jgi:manganese transport protein
MNPFKAFRNLGPSWVISAVACGPATLASVTMSGSSFGYAFLWVVILSAVFGATAQYLAAKTAVVFEKGIISLVRERYGRVMGAILTLDALAATWLAAVVLMKALVAITSYLTGLSTPWWGILYAILFSVLLIRGGYPLFETVCKLLVVGIVLCFIATLFVVPIDWPNAFRGILPSLAGGGKGAIIMAGIMGGAVHITIIAMHTYTVQERSWRIMNLPIVRLDVISSMLVAFGIYSMIIFLVSAATLHTYGIHTKGALGVAKSLKPILGPYASVAFFAGLWGATISTIMPTFQAGAYFLADFLGFPMKTEASRFKLAILAGILLSLIGPFLKGAFFPLLIVMLALGLCGTPLILVLLLLLINSQRRPDLSPLKNRCITFLGAVTTVISLFLAIRFIISLLEKHL